MYYTLKQNEIGSFVCDEVWIGSRMISNVTESENYIYGWCDTNVVPNNARDILVRFIIFLTMTKSSKMGTLILFIVTINCGELHKEYYCLKKIF